MKLPSIVVGGLIAGCASLGAFEKLSGLDQRMIPRFSPFYLADLQQCRGKIDEACEKAAPMFSPTPGRPLYVEFYFANCRPCWGNRWAVDEMARRLRGKADVVELSIDCDIEEYRRWLNHAEEAVPVLYGCEAEIVDELNVAAFPTGVLFDGRGAVILRHKGIFSQARLDEIIAKALSVVEK